jgi:predicted ATP-dependent serine protease
MTNPWESTECETCGGSARKDTGRCDACWEVEHRLEWYLTTENGLKNVLEEIKQAGLSVHAYGPLMVSAIKDAMKEESNE